MISVWWMKIDATPIRERTHVQEGSILHREVPEGRLSVGGPPWSGREETFELGTKLEAGAPHHEIIQSIPEVKVGSPTLEEKIATCARTGGYVAPNEMPHSSRGQLIQRNPEFENWSCAGRKKTTRARIDVPCGNRQTRRLLRTVRISRKTSAALRTRSNNRPEAGSRKLGLSPVDEKKRTRENRIAV